MPQRKKGRQNNKKNKKNKPGYYGNDSKKTAGRAGSASVSEGSTPIESIISVKEEEEFEKEICPVCEKNSADGCGNPCMCFSCGLFLCCGACYGRPEMQGDNGLPNVLFSKCPTCMEKDEESDYIPGLLLQNLLKEKPTGCHVNYARYILAQFSLNDAEDFTGIPQDIEWAKAEYMSLANDCDYAPAQLTMASFFDPIYARHGYNWDGPTALHLINEGKYPLVPSPFPPNRKKALMYYERACQQKLSKALSQVGIDTKNGDGLFPQDVYKGVRMLEEAGEMGDTVALSNLAKFHLRQGQMEQGYLYASRAAELGSQQSMFIVAQMGMHEPEFWDAGRKYTQKLCEAGWADNDIPGGYEMFRQITHFYGFNMLDYYEFE